MMLARERAAVNLAGKGTGEDHGSGGDRLVDWARCPVHATTHDDGDRLMQTAAPLTPSTRSGSVATSSALLPLLGAPIPFRSTFDSYLQMSGGEQAGDACWLAAVD